jgi:hypothetical protein
VPVELFVKIPIISKAMERNTQRLLSKLLFSCLFLIAFATTFIIIFWMIPESDRSKTLVGIFTAIFAPWKITVVFAILASFFAGQLYFISKNKRR